MKNTIGSALDEAREQMERQREEMGRIVREAVGK